MLWEWLILALPDPKCTQTLDTDITSKIGFSVVGVRCRESVAVMSGLWEWGCVCGSWEWVSVSWYVSDDGLWVILGCGYTGIN